MLPAFVMTNVTDPAAILACDSATLHSDSFTLTCEAPSRRACGAAPIIAPSRAMVVELRFMAASSSRGVVWCPPVGPRASPLYSLGNIQVTCGVSIRQWTAHPEDRLESSELERFEAIVLPHLDAAYTLARYLTRNDHDAQDIVQDAYLRALKYFGGFRGQGGAGDGRAWLLAIVRNTAHTWRRRHRSDALTTEFDEKLHSNAVAEDTPATALDSDSARESLYQALDRLGPGFREGSGR